MAPRTRSGAGVATISSRDEAAYTVRAFEKEGKSGMYFTLSFERLEKAPRPSSWDASDLDD